LLLGDASPGRLSRLRRKAAGQANQYCLSGIKSQGRTVSAAPALLLGGGRPYYSLTMSYSES